MISPYMKRVPRIYINKSKPQYARDNKTINDLLCDFYWPKLKQQSIFVYSVNIINVGTCRFIAEPFLPMQFFFLGGILVCNYLWRDSILWCRQLVFICVRFIYHIKSRCLIVVGGDGSGSGSGGWEWCWFESHRIVMYSILLEKCYYHY